MGGALVPGIIEQQIQPAIRCRDALKQSPHRIRLADVGWGHQHLRSFAGD